MKAYIATKITDLGVYDRITYALDLKAPDRRCFNCGSRYLTFNHCGSMQLGSRITRAADLAVLPAHDFIACVLLNCEPEDLPNREYVLCLPNGKLVVPTEGDAKLGSVYVMRGVLKRMLLTYKDFYTHQAVDSGLELLGGKLHLEQINELLEVL